MHFLFLLFHLCDSLKRVNNIIAPFLQMNKQALTTTDWAKRLTVEMEMSNWTLNLTPAAIWCLLPCSTGGLA